MNGAIVTFTANAEVCKVRLPSDHVVFKLHGDWNPGYDEPPDVGFFWTSDTFFKLTMPTTFGKPITIITDNPNDVEAELRVLLGSFKRTKGEWKDQSYQRVDAHSPSKSTFRDTVVNFSWSKPKGVAIIRFKGCFGNAELGPPGLPGDTGLTNGPLSHRRCVDALLDLASQSNESWLHQSDARARIRHYQHYDWSRCEMVIPGLHPWVEARHLRQHLKLRHGDTIVFGKCANPAAPSSFNAVVDTIYRELRYHVCQQSGPIVYLPYARWGFQATFPTPCGSQPGWQSLRRKWRYRPSSEASVFRNIRSSAKEGETFQPSTGERIVMFLADSWDRVSRLEVQRLHALILWRRLDCTHSSNWGSRSFPRWQNHHAWP